MSASLSGRTNVRGRFTRTRVLAAGAAAASAVVVAVVVAGGGGGGQSCTGADVTTATLASRVSGSTAGDTLAPAQRQLRHVHGHQQGDHHYRQRGRNRGFVLRADVRSGRQ